ncbi:hypothetical protein ES703_105045 [subsurface metagenome]
MPDIRLTQCWVLANKVESLYLPFIGGVNNLSESQPRKGVQATSPGSLKFLPDSRVADSLVAGIDIGQSTKVTGTLHIVLTPQRINPG